MEQQPRGTRRDPRVGITAPFRRGLGRRPPTLRRAWTTAVIRLVVIMVALGAVGIGAAEFQHRLFSRTAAVLEHDIDALVTADLAHVAITAPATGLMYRVDGSTLESSRVAYDEARRNLNEALDHLLTTAASPEARRLGSSAQATWEETDAGILAAGSVSDQELATAFASGVDPYLETIWKPYNETVVTFSELGAQIAADLRVRTDEAARTQRIVIPVVLAGLLMALVVAVITTRLVSRRVVAPLVELRGGAVALRDSDSAPAIDLTGSVAEIQEIASAFNETAASLRESHGLLRHQARTDELTELPNRAAFAEHVYARLTTSNPEPMSVLYVDLDDLKIVNDSLGHAAGDVLLRIAASRLRALVRDTEMVARLGGDEFGMAIDGDSEMAAAVAGRVLTALDEDVQVAEGRVRVSCSIGIATVGPGCEADGDTLARQADFAMYMAKRQGKNRYEIFSESMHDEIASRSKLTEQLAEAIRSDQLVLHYQPVVEVASGDVLGFEALVRWDHPDKGLLGPSEFIHLAEQTGAIVDLGSWVLDRVCSDLAIYLREGGDPTHWMSLNVSIHEITGIDFAHSVLAAIDRHLLPPTSIVVEVTESTAITSQSSTHEALDALRERGVRIALDDFGTGFSSLCHLHDLPVDVLKIDRSFISDPSRNTNAMIETIVDLATRLGLDVIAEGVETEDQLIRLRRFESMAVQGYHFGRPSPSNVALHQHAAKALA